MQGNQVGHVGDRARVDRPSARYRGNEEDDCQMERHVSVAKARQVDQIGQTIVVKGWIRTRRDSKGGFSFLEVNDGSSLANLQVICDAELANYTTEVQKLSAGCSVVCLGTLVASEGKGQATELRAAQVSVLGWADPEEYPLQKKRHSFEKLREWAHLRPRTNALGAVTRVRNVISRSIHNFFQEHDFLYIQTPIITASDCEGAGEMFKVTTLDLDNLPRVKGRVDYEQDFFFATRVSYGQWPVGRRNLCLRHGQDLYVWTDVSGRKLQYLSPSRRVLDGGARDGFP